MVEGVNGATAGGGDEGEGEPLRVGLLGYGLAGEAFHAPLIASTPGLELAAVVTSREERAAAVRQRYPKAGVFPTATELFESGAIDVVVVASPNETHVPLAKEALERGFDVVVDKPVAPTAEAARSLQALADEVGRVVTVYQNRRWDTDYLTLRHVLDAGSLGDVRRFESRFESWSPRAKGGWRESADPSQAGGLLYDLGAHLIDQAVQLFGPVEAVYAELDVRRPGVGSDDDVFVALRHVDGVRSHLWMSKVAADFGPRLRVLGSEAAFVAYGLDPQEAALREGQGPSQDTWIRLTDGRTAHLARGTDVEAVPYLPGDYRAFYTGLERAVRQRTAPPVAVEEAAYVLDVIAAARRSAASRTVELLS
jgi:scyllo-inositol 2-dehydrogenase (NADP+)